MENKVEIINVNIFEKEGKKYLKALINIDDIIDTLGIDVYDEFGNKNPLVDSILSLAMGKNGCVNDELALKNDDKSELEDLKEHDFEDDTQSDKLEVESEQKDNTEENNEQCKALVVYENPNEKSKVNRNYKGIIASGLAGILIGFGIMSMFKSCEQDKTDSSLNNETLIEQDQTTITYITKEQYHTGVQALREYLNTTFNMNYKTVDLNAFYYVANIDNISNETFDNLIKEGYLPDTDVDIIQSVFNVTSDLKTKFFQTNKMDIDYSKLFVNKTMVKISTEYQDKYNQINNASTEEIKNIIKDLEDYMIINAEKGYNVLPVGGEFIFNTIISDSIAAQANTKGVTHSQALESEMINLNDIVKAIQGELNCIAITETEKQLKK